jgi:phosphocarrier protein HPr
MKEVKTFTLQNELGLHARAAAMLVAVSSSFKSKILFERDGMEINGKSILGILTLACPKGSRITISAEGDDAREVMAELGNLIEGKFGED